METTQVTLTVRGETSPGEVIAVVGSCEALGSWSHQKAVTLCPDGQDGNTWTTTITVPKGVVSNYRYLKGFFLEPKRAGGPCQVIVDMWETHHQPRTMSPTESHQNIDDGQFGIHNGVKCVDSGWLTCQTEIRLRLHYSKLAPVSITKKKFKKSRFRIKLTLEGVEEEEDEEEDELSPSPLQKMATTLEISMISADGYKSRHSQPECGYALEPSRWTEYIIHTMDPYNLELTFEFFEEDLSEHVVQGDAQSGYVGTACLLSSCFSESCKDNGVVTLPIMGRNSRQTIGKVRVDYLVIRPIQGMQCDMSSSFTKYWKKRSTLYVGHRGAGSTKTKHQRVRENTIASFKSAAKHGAAYVEFDVHLSKDSVPIIYHDMSCCISTKKKNDKNSLELIEVPVKDLTFDQLQLLKLAHSAMKGNDDKDLQDDEDEIDEHQPFPSLPQIFQAIPENVGFNIELKWICQLKDGTWYDNLSSYFQMNTFLDIILSCVLQKGGKRRIVFSCFDPDICTMVRQKQNKYPILFLTQGITDTYPEMMDIRCQNTQIAISFAQSENILGISAHTEDLLKNLSYIGDAQSKGLVVFSWGDDNNDHENRKRLREQGIDGLIYDSICEEEGEQLNIFQVEEQHSLQEVISEETMKSSSCSCYSIPCSTAPCIASNVHAGGVESDSGVSSS